jgi:rod shape-determining protein MreD
MMAQIAQWFLVFAASLILQASFVPVISIAGIKPDLLLVVLFFFCIRYGVMPGIFVGFFMGLGVDLYSPSLLGQNAFVAMVTGAFLGLFNERMMRTDPLIKMALLFVAFIIHDSLFLIVQVVKLGDPVSTIFGGLFLHTLPRAIYSIAIAALWFAWDMLVKPLARK